MYIIYTIFFVMNCTRTDLDLKWISSLECHQTSITLVIEGERSKKSSNTTSVLLLAPSLLLQNTVTCCITSLYSTAVWLCSATSTIHHCGAVCSCVNGGGGGGGGTAYKYTKAAAWFRPCCKATATSQVFLLDLTIRLWFRKQRHCCKCMRTVLWK